MGHEIVYCFKCQIRLLGSDFETGKAFRIDAQAVCPPCARALLAHLPDPDAELDRLKRTQVPKSTGSSTKLPAIRPLESTSRIPAQPRSTVREIAAPRPKSPLPLLLGVGGVVLVVILALVVLSSGPAKPPSTPDPIVDSPPPRPPKPKPAPPVDVVARDLEELDARTSLYFRKDQILEIARLIAADREKHRTPDWARGIEERLQKLEAAARRVAEPLLAQIEPAARKGDAALLKDLRGRIDALGVPALGADVDRAVAAAAADPWIPIDLQSPASQEGATITAREDHSLLVGGPNPDHDTLTASAHVGLKQVRAFRVEALADVSLPAGGPGRAENGNFVLSEFKVVADGRPLAFSGSSSDWEQDKYPSSAALDGNPLTGWAVSGRFGQASAAVFHLERPVDVDQAVLTLEHRSVHLRHVLGCFRISVSVLELPPPPPPRPAEATPPVVVPKIPPDVLAYQQAWASALRLAATRDFASAIRTVGDARAALKDEALRKEAETDLAGLKLAAEALDEAPRLLPRWSKGTKLQVEFIGETGAAELLEGVLLDVSARGITLQTEEGTLGIPAGELGAGSIAALLALRGEKRPGDARAAAVLAALEGRPPADLLKKYEGAKGAADSPESEARHLFWSAEEDYAGERTRNGSGAAYATLLEKFGQTAFTTRNKAFLEDRLAGTRDVFLFADDLPGAGTFTLASSSKLESYWTSTADSPEGQAAANYLEAEILIQPGATYRAWIYAGGCCQEVFAFSLQGSGLSGPSARNPKETVTAEPGSGESIATRLPYLSLRKKHSDHTGPKEPDRWAWIELGTLKFAEPGVKKLRILTDQKGFSVAYLVVSATRQSQPRDSELRDLVKYRPPAEYPPTGSILREIWKGIGGDAVSDLTNNPKFKDGKPDLSGPISAVDSWNMGDSYGCRIRGYVHPPVTGDYVFWIASDDHGELWLSSDETPAKKQKLCGLNHAVGQRDWDADPSQKSAPVPLVAGRRYYLEVLQKQGGGGEHVAAGWQLPGGAMERPLPPSRLSPVGALPARKVRRPVFREVPIDGPLKQSARIGGAGGGSFVQAPTPRRFMSGLRYSIAPTGCLKGLQPLYVGGTEGGRVGKGSFDQEVVARPGYAVAGLIGRGTDRLNAFKLVFMRISGSRLVSSDRYESDWVGTRGGGEVTTLGADGTPVFGIYGQAGEEIDGAGLLLLGKK